jgi:hypothetical protein
MGSACCVWQDGLSSYVLSAAHVVGGLGEAAGIQWMGVSGELGLGQTLEPSLYWMSSHGGDLDAGLVRVSVAGPFAHSFGYPWAHRVMSWDAIDSIRSVIICGKFGQVFATFDGKVAPGTVFAGHRHGRLLRLRYDSAATLGGDSGSPIISLPEGMLVGMHVARDVNPLFSLAVAADDVVHTFLPRLPGFRLRP